MAGVFRTSSAWVRSLSSPGTSRLKFNSPTPESISCDQHLLSFPAAPIDCCQHGLTISQTGMAPCWRATLSAESLATKCQATSTPSGPLQATEKVLLLQRDFRGIHRRRWVLRLSPVAELKTPPHTLKKLSRCKGFGKRNRLAFPRQLSNRGGNGVAWQLTLHSHNNPCADATPRASREWTSRTISAKIILGRMNLAETFAQAAS